VLITSGFNNYLPTIASSGTGVAALLGTQRQSSEAATVQNTSHKRRSGNETDMQSKLMVTERLEIKMTKAMRYVEPD
jgi:hypothetical protein